MRYSIITSLLSGATVILGSPIEKRTHEYAVDFAAPPGGDATILNYALTLEYLERKFYEEGLKNFTQAQFIEAGFVDPFYTNLQEIYGDEQTHVTTLSTALTAAGATPVNEAKYAFGVTSAKQFVTLSSVLEGVGVSAYLGAAGAIVDKSYLTVAGSILTVEARHSAYIRSQLKQSPFPKAFDTPLDFNSVFSLAAQFITGFSPSDGPLPFKAFPPLTLQPSQDPYTAGSSPVTFSGAKKMAVEKNLVAEHATIYAVFYSGLDTYYVETYCPGGDSGDLQISCIPEGAKGQVYVVLSTANGDDTKVKDENVVSGVGILEVV